MLLTPLHGAAAQSAPVVAASVPKTAYRDLAAASPNTPIHLAITLAYRQPDRLEQLIAMESDPGSPYFRHWLNSAQFDAAFAPDPATYARAIAALERAGFRVDRTFVNRTVLDVSGTVGAADRYFATRIDVVKQLRHGIRLANVTSAHVPQDLQGILYSVTGLHGLSVFQTHHMPVRRGSAPGRMGARAKGSDRGIYGPTNTLDGWTGYGPLAFQRAYDFPSSRGAANIGTGSKAGILIDADFADSDLTAYLAYFGIKRTGTTNRVLVDGGPGSNPIAGDAPIEATLDVESLVGDAPGVGLYMYETPDFGDAGSLTYVLDAYNKVVDDNIVGSLNSSFGTCENGDLTYSETLDHIAEQGAALGITFHASTGDTGAFSCEDTSGNLALGAQVPASSSHVVAVGGTTLLVDSTGKYEGEEGWNSNGGASGGGVSSVFLLPSWQKGVAGIVTLGRNLPDVSFDADPSTGFALYYGGTWNNDYNPVGGTSLASPLFGAAVAQLTQVSHGRLGLAAEGLFKLWKATGYFSNGNTYFHDSIFGNNGYDIAVKGYDRVTGIGSFDVSNAQRGLTGSR
jgi:subtilase family serine protease